MQGDRATTIEDVEAYLTALPATLGIWRTTSRIEHWPLLAWLNVWPVQELRETAKEVGLPLALTTRHTELHNALGLAVRWADVYLRPTVVGSPEELERRGLMRRATDAWVLGDLLRSTQGGVYEFRPQGNHLTFDFIGDPAVEALDNLLTLAYELEDWEELRSRLHSEDGSGSAPFGELRSYISTSGGNVAWEEANEPIQRSFRTMADKMVDGMRRVSAPESLPIDGFTLGQALAVWRELLAGALYRNLCLFAGSHNPLVAAPARSPDQMVDELAPCGLDSTVIRNIIDFLTFDATRDEDPCLAPIVPVGRVLVPMSSLITPSSPERNILAKARNDPNLFGRIGAQIGKIGPATVGAALRTIPNTQVSTEVKVRGSGNQTLGDLDVVVIDEEAKLAAIFEVKWQLEPDGAKELDKAEAQAEEGQAQIRRLRPLVETGQVDVRWPTTWPELASYEWQWFVITSNVIPMTRVGVEDVPARSHRLLTMMALRRGATLRQVCETFSTPPLPREGEEFILHTSTRRVGPYTVSVRRPS